MPSGSRPLLGIDLQSIAVPGLASRRFRSYAASFPPRKRAVDVASTSTRAKSQRHLNAETMMLMDALNGGRHRGVW